MSYLARLRLAETRSEMPKCANLRSTESADEKIICPKPQRVAVSNLRSVDAIKPMRHVRSMSPVERDGSDAGCEILDIFLRKSSPFAAFGCSPPIFSGSPPSRATNPLVRDTQFLRSHYPTVDRQVSVPSNVPAKPAPIVRVEGFDCGAARSFECTGHDSRCRVSAFA
ncbi:hypothetical protein KP509_19G044800 [Ceratopteris richardii]|uniref:Uncharacterized protein n=1 Tax=Ceratopteris richardii TaxID=49495 RepID=A0A8T2SNJ4_CERRI|nr:hypothetical protein KP509_19G044800 [Ceratopteris richardii]KAH7352434.1 hypothetical protein KP509_19G044800 [Ceratopteris richardii]